MMTELTLTPPSGFQYWPTVTSHGWCVLHPFSYDESARSLATIVQLQSGAVVRLEIRPAGGALTIAVGGLAAAPTDAQQAEIGAVFSRVLGFDQDVQAFYALARTIPGYAWIEAAGAGRMLVSPTVWEDLAKTLLTTNTTWAMTRQMVARLASLGEPFSGGGHAFPSPQRLAAMDADALNAHVKAGYRGAYLRELATDIAEGRFDPNDLTNPAHSDIDVYKRLKSIKGFGDYAAGAMSRLLGRFDALGLDSVCRTMYKDQMNGGIPATDKEIAAYYAPFGPWRGLAIWMDVMKESLVQP
jgi:3-methyladenine DNA glycosylase/8-oxoguanine DNA glycosylase